MSLGVTRNLAAAPVRNLSIDPNPSLARSADSKGLLSDLCHEQTFQASSHVKAQTSCCGFLKVDVDSRGGRDDQQFGQQLWHPQSRSQ